MRTCSKLPLSRNVHENLKFYSMKMLPSIFEDSSEHYNTSGK